MKIVLLFILGFASIAQADSDDVGCANFVDETVMEKMKENDATFSLTNADFLEPDINSLRAKAWKVVEVIGNGLYLPDEDSVENCLGGKEILKILYAMLNKGLKTAWKTGIGRTLDEDKPGTPKEAADSPLGKIVRLSKKDSDAYFARRDEGEYKVNLGQACYDTKTVLEKDKTFLQDSNDKNTETLEKLEKKIEELFNNKKCKA